MEAFLEGLHPYSIHIAIVLLVLILVLFIMVSVLFYRNWYLRRRLDAFMRGADGESLENSLRHVVEDNKKFRIQLKNNVDAIVKLNENMLTAYRKIGVVKFNAFPGMAGKVSSSVALLNNENNGILITTIHGQDGGYTYVKEIMNGKSVSPLTKEDEEALRIAVEDQF